MSVVFLGAPVAPSEAVAVVRFWREAGVSRWFAKDPAFDQTFRASFLDLYERAARGELDGWTITATGALALIILLDQFPRNSFRDTPRMYATDAHALRIAKVAVEAGLDRMIDEDLRLFVYMPYGHSEDIADHDAGAILVRSLGAQFVLRAEKYSGIIRQFGRFPHRNRILGRTNTDAEKAFLEQGGFSG